MKKILPAAALALLLASCADTVPVDRFEPDQSVAELDEVLSGSPIGPAPSQQEIAEGAAALNLEAVTNADFSSPREPGQGCTFTSAADELLLISSAAPGATSRPRAVVRLGGSAQSLEAMRDGGYEYLTSGAAFQNARGMTVSIVRQDNAIQALPAPVEDVPAEDGAERASAAPVQAWPATLSVITEGAEQEYPGGIYSCGQ